MVMNSNAEHNMPPEPLESSPNANDRYCDVIMVRLSDVIHKLAPDQRRIPQLRMYINHQLDLRPNT